MPKHLMIALAGGCLAAASFAHADLGDYYYDATDANWLSFDGSSEAGSVRFDSMVDRSFRVQRAGWADETQTGLYAAQGATLALSVDLLSFLDAGQGGPSDRATFAGTAALGGHDFVITDSVGGAFTASISVLEMVDRTNSWVQPYFQGAARLENVTFSGSTFEGVDVAGLERSGYLSFTAMASGVDSMRAYFDSPESEQSPLLLGTLEVTLGQAVPAPGGLAICGAGALVLGRRRRRG